MDDTARDPVDHARTTRRFTGETMKNTRTSPGLALAAMGIVAFVIGLYLFAVGNAAGGALASAIAVIVGGGGVMWILSEHRRVVRHERRWLAEHPNVRPEPPMG